MNVSGPLKVRVMLVDFLQIRGNKNHLNICEVFQNVSVHKLFIYSMSIMEKSSYNKSVRKSKTKR